MIWRKFSDDWFTYYINIKTGEKKNLYLIQKI